MELLWWEGCPSTEGALALLRETMDELGLDPSSIRMTEIATDEQARDTNFLGSPTVLVNGQDIQPPDSGAQIGLSCRVYRRHDGRVSPLPDRDDLREALRR